MRPFCAVAESAQADYEALREAALQGGPFLTIASRRFERRGLAGLISWPIAEPVFAARLVGASRPPWTPYVDPRPEALASGYELVRACGGELTISKEAQR